MYANVKRGKQGNRYCMLTLDTEGDNIWKIRSSEFSISRITNRNGEFLERFQELSEQYGLVPTYLVNYEMTLSKPFCSMVKNHKDNLEIGMHMHAFNTPPYYELSDRYGGNKAYIGEYPVEIQEQKVAYLTKKLEDTFQMPIKSHRGGRWYIDPRYISILQKYGYIVDCTVTPGINWTGNAGQTKGSHGIDFRRAPARAYYMSTENVCKHSNKGMLEIPVSIIKKKEDYKERVLKCDLWNRSGNHARHSWLRPTGSNLKEMVALVEEKTAKNDYIEFMIHSSELMPGGSPTFGSKESIEELYCDIERLFQHIKKNNYQGIGLFDYAKKII